MIFDVQFGNNVSILHGSLRAHCIPERVAPECVAPPGARSSIRLAEPLMLHHLTSTLPVFPVFLLERLEFRKLQRVLGLSKDEESLS